jgi:hypothetical protein
VADKDTLRRKAKQAKEISKRLAAQGKEAGARMVDKAGKVLKDPKVKAARDKAAAKGRSAAARGKAATVNARNKVAELRRTGGKGAPNPGKAMVPKGPVLRADRVGARTGTALIPTGNNPPAPPGGGGGGGAAGAADDAAKKSLLSRVLKNPVVRGANVASVVATGANYLGDKALDSDEQRAADLREGSQLGPLAPSGGDVYRDDGLATPLRSGAMGIDEWWDRTDISEAAKSYFTTPPQNWKAPTEANFPEAVPTGRGYNAQVRRGLDDQALMDAAVSPGAVTSMQDLRRNLSTAVDPETGYPDQRGQFAAAAEGVAGSPEELTDSLYNLGVNPDLQQQVGLRQRRGIAPLVGYNANGRPTGIRNTDTDVMVHAAQDEPIGASTGRIRSRMQDDGSVLLTDLPQAGTLPGTQDQLRGVLDVPQFGQEAIDSTVDHLNRNRITSARLAGEHAAGNLHVLGGPEKMLTKNKAYRDREQRVLRQNVDEGFGAMREGREANLRDSGRRDPLDTLPTFAEINAIEDEGARRAAIMDRQVRAGRLASAELQHMTSPRAIQQAVDPTGQLGRSKNRRDRDELRERRDAYLEQQKDAISAKYGVNQDVDSLDASNTSLKSTLEMLKFQRDGIKFNSEQADRAADRTDAMITRLDPEGASGLQQDALTIGLYDDPSLSDQQRNDALSALQTMRALSEIYPSMKSEFQELLANTPPENVYQTFRNYFEDGTLELRNPGFWHGLGQVFQWDAMQGMDEIGADLINMFTRGQPQKMVGKPSRGDSISLEELSEEMGTDEAQLRRILPR